MHQRSVNINSSSVTFDVDFINDFAITEIFYDQYVSIEVEFVDSLTAQLAAASTNVNIARFRHEISYKGASIFKPGLPYIFKLTVKKFDGSPANEHSEIFVKTAFNDAPPLEEHFTLESSGTVDLETMVPINATSLQIFVSNLIHKLAARKLFLYHPLR